MSESNHQKQESYTEMVPVRLSPAQKIRLLQVSRVTGRPVSALVRDMIESDLCRYEAAWDSVRLAS